MANANRPSGLSPVAHMSAVSWTGGGRTYCIPSTDGNVFAIGDPVTLAGSSDSRGVPTITLATAGDANMVLGSILSMGGLVYGGPYADPTNLNTVLVPATKAASYYVLVADDPGTIFEVQDIGTGTALAATDTGLNINLVSGTNNGALSGWMLNNASKATTSTYQMKLLGLTQRPDNIIGQYGKWLCIINNHCFRAGQTGV